MLVTALPLTPAPLFLYFMGGVWGNPLDMVGRKERLFWGIGTLWTGKGRGILGRAVGAGGLALPAFCEGKVSKLVFFVYALCFLVLNM